MVKEGKEKERRKRGNQEQRLDSSEEGRRGTEKERMERMRRADIMKKGRTGILERRVKGNMREKKRWNTEKEEEGENARV